VLRAADAEPGARRAVEGIAVPYGEVWSSPGGYRESFAPGAFAADAERWMTRTDGARLPFLYSHERRELLGAVVQLEDRAEGLYFRAELRDTPLAADYLDGVELGANGTSVEFAPVGRPTKQADVTVHRTARLGAIAGSLTPAYDTARVAARSEDAMTTETRETPPAPEPQPEPQPEPPAPEPASLARRSAELATLERMDSSPATVTRPELIYGPRSEHGFIRDLVAAGRGDSDARERQARHQAQVTDAARQLYDRAGEVLTSELGGAIPTEFMPGLFVPRILKGRPMGSFFQRFAITDARPRTFAKVTTSTTVAAQGTEGTNVAASDFGTTAESATPVLYSGHTKVSRQVLDSADPAAEAMILEDLIEAYAQVTEAAIVAGTEAAATGSAALDASDPFAGLVSGIIAYQGARFQPAEAVFASPTVYANALKQTAADGRLMVPWLGPANAGGQQDAGAAGASVIGVPLILSWASTDGTAGVGAISITARRTDMVIYESAVARFSYEQVDGPAAIKLGIWAYMAFADRRGAVKSGAATALEAGATAGKSKS
jgi:HK97 family phage prohead protease/HK97 family phage major capsid protein